MRNINHKWRIAQTAFILSIFLMSYSNLHARDLKEKVKRGIENVSENIKKKVDELAGDAAALQSYFDEYSWKGMIEDEVTVEPATLSNVQMKGHSKATIVKPGEEIECQANCFLDPNKCSSLSFYRVVIGIKGEGAQTTIGNCLGTVAGKSTEKWVLRAPEKPGIYEVRFRVVTHFTESEALKSWVDEKGKEPHAKTTIGIVVVQ